MFFSERMSANTALELGIVDLIVEEIPASVEDLEWVQRIADGPSVALNSIKENLLLSERESLQAVIDLEAMNAAKCSRTDDVKEAAASFREKRRPQFSGK